MKRKRLILLTILSTFIISFISHTCLASNDIISITPQENIFIYDTADLIDDTIEKEINLLLMALEEKSEVEVAVISIPSLNSMTIEEYANKLFNTLGIGKKGKDNGALLIFSKPDNKVRLEIGRGLEGCLNDGKCGRILDNYFVPYREKGNYSDATEFTVNALLSVISKEYNIEIEGVEAVDVEDEEGIHIWVFVLLIVLLLLVLIAQISSGGSSGRGFYGGSSGGFSSGGGGFGGGFSGGGGASR